MRTIDEYEALNSLSLDLLFVKLKPAENLLCRKRGGFFFSVSQRVIRENNIRFKHCFKFLQIVCFLNLKVHVCFTLLLSMFRYFSPQGHPAVILRDRLISKFIIITKMFSLCFFKTVFDLVLSKD